MKKEGGFNMEFLGIDGQHIPYLKIRIRRLDEFNSEVFDIKRLKDGDVIENEHGEQLVYLDNEKVYRLHGREDARYRYLAFPTSEWKKL